MEKYKLNLIINITEVEKMQRLTNMYYSQYDSSIESEPAYDSDNLEIHEKLIQSPSQAEFRHYIARRNDEELLHESWKFSLREKINLARKIKEQCGMAVDLGDNRVQYIYKPDFGGNHTTGIKFRITFIYVKLLRKWYISLGRSRIPDMINFHDKVKNGTYNPIGPKILGLIRKVKNLLEIFVKRLIFIYEFIDHVKEVYKDIEFQVDEYLTNIKIILKEKGWPNGIKKTSNEDIIGLKVILDKNLKVDNLTYEYVHSNELPAKKKKMSIDKLEYKLSTFFNFPLMEAFEMFMNEETPVQSESFVESSPQTSF